MGLSKTSITIKVPGTLCTVINDETYKINIFIIISGTWHLLPLLGSTVSFRDGYQPSALYSIGFE